MGPWYPTTYVKEVFLDVSKLPRVLENAWYVTGKEMTYLGDVALDADPDLSTASLQQQMTPQIPPDTELKGKRKWFARILRQEYVLRHLEAETAASLPPYLIGWTSQGFTNVSVDGNVKTDDETLVIFRPTPGL